MHWRPHCGVGSSNEEGPGARLLLCNNILTGINHHPVGSTSITSERHSKDQTTSHEAPPLKSLKPPHTHTHITTLSSWLLTLLVSSTNHIQTTYSKSMVSATNYMLVTSISVLDVNMTARCLTSDSSAHTSLLDTHHCSLSSQNGSIILPGRVEERNGSDVIIPVFSGLHSINTFKFSFNNSFFSLQLWPGSSGLPSSSCLLSLESSWNPRYGPPMHWLTLMT